MYEREVKETGSEGISKKGERYGMNGEYIAPPIPHL
jgi:hypothetical protein